MPGAHHQVELSEGAQVLGDGMLVQAEYIRQLTRPGGTVQPQQDQQDDGGFRQRLEAGNLARSQGESGGNGCLLFRYVE